MWLKRLCSDFQIDCNDATLINVDNQSCIKMCETMRFSNRTKHVDTKYHFIGDLKKKNVIDIKYCTTENNVADMLTKPLKFVRLEILRNIANVCCVRNFVLC